MAKPTTYVARRAGIVIGTRKSHRTYTHAVVVQDNQEKARAAAYGYTATDTDRSNFDYYTSIVAAEGKTVEMLPGMRSDLRKAGDVGQAIGKWANGERYAYSYTATEMANAKAMIAGGFDAYVARLRDRMVAAYEAKVAAGGFAPYVASWCGRPDLAQKEANRRGALDVVCAEALA